MALYFTLRVNLGYHFMKNAFGWFKRCKKRPYSEGLTECHLNLDRAAHKDATTLSAGAASQKGVFF